MKTLLKRALAALPYASKWVAGLQSRPNTRFKLQQLADRMPDLVTAVPSVPSTRGRLLLFAPLHYWIEQAVVLAFYYRAMGYTVTLAYLPYSSWEKPIEKYDLVRQDVYVRKVLEPAAGLIDVVSLLEVPAAVLSEVAEKCVVRASESDYMYSMQCEDVDQKSPLYQLRMERNRAALASALTLVERLQPLRAIVPNGLVTELGIFYQACRLLGVPCTTYEFNDQREQIWLAQDDIVMRQDTTALWQHFKNTKLGPAQRNELAAFEAARRGGRVYGKGTRRWQETAASGTSELRSHMGLDERPVVLLATNVLGDSLTLGRNLFAKSMAEWISRSVQYFSRRSDLQLVVRVHPGEKLIKGPSAMRTITNALDVLPGNIHIVAPAEPINTYDLIDIADIGLVYTTTVGLEMALAGKPVVVCGATHYRGRGFTADPDTWENYFAKLDSLIASPHARQMSSSAVAAAWNYAYRFFFQYPQPFPWRLMHFWKDYAHWPLQRVLGADGRQQFGATFDCLAGGPFAWAS